MQPLNNPTAIIDFCLAPLNLDTGTDGYQVMTMRMMKRRVVTENNGPRKPASSFAWSGSRGSSATPRSQSA